MKLQQRMFKLTPLFQTNYKSTSNSSQCQIEIQLFKLLTFHRKSHVIDCLWTICET